MWNTGNRLKTFWTDARMLLKWGTGSGEREAGSGKRGTEVWEQVVSDNLHKNPIWPMIGDRKVALLLELYAHEVLEIIRR